MAVETTVLLVQEVELPEALEAQLEKKSVYLEESDVGDLMHSVVAVAPNLVVYSGTADVGAVLDACEGQQEQVPVVVVAARTAHRALREKFQARIAALVPSELPVPALAHRIFTLAQRSAKGEALQKTPSFLPGARPSALAADTAKPSLQSRVTSNAAVAGKPTSQKKPGQSLRPSAPKPAALKDEPAALKDEPIALKDAPPPPAGKVSAPAGKALETPVDQASLKQASEAPAPPAAAPRSSLVNEKVTKKADLPALQASASRAAVDRSGPPPSAPPPAAFPLEPEFRQTTPRRIPDSEPPDSDDSPYEHETVAVSVADALRVQKAETLAQTHRKSDVAASAVRVVLIDDDLTRADAIAGELREHGLDVMLLSPEHSQARWPFLRRFAPHGLIVDERSLSKGSRQIVGAFRRDPFLKYVPLVAIRFERLFKESDARASLAPIMRHLAPLGREELLLIDRLKQSNEIAVDLSQILPTRLIELLGQHEQNCVLTCHSAGQRLTWALSQGRVGKAEVTDRPGSPGLTVPPEDALRWLLLHDEPQITVALRAQIRLTGDVPIGPLLEKVTSQVEAPAEHSIMPKRRQSAPAGPREGGVTRTPQESTSQTRTLDGIGMPRAASADSYGLEELTEELEEIDSSPMTMRAPMPDGLPPEAVRSDSPARAHFDSHAEAEGLLRDLPRQRAPSHIDGQPKDTSDRLAPVAAGLAGALGALGGAGAWLLERAGDFWAALVHFVQKQQRELPPNLFRAIAAAFVLLVLLVAVLSVRACSSDAPGPPPKKVALPKAAPAKAPEPAPQQAPKEESKEDQEKARQLALWRVAPDSQLKGCEELVGKAVKTEPKGNANGYWSAARKALMQGDVDGAHDMMCRSALIEPTGAAAEGLAGFYLGRRSVENAEYWIEQVLMADPERRRAQELLGDVRSQQGRSQDALQLWLATMKLHEDEEVKRSAISRKLVLDAKAALSSGDQPRAERNLRRAAALDPLNVDASASLAQIYLRAGLHDAAILWAEESLSAEPRSGAAMMVLGDVARLKKDFAEARTQYGRVPEGDANRARAQDHLSNMPR